MSTNPANEPNGINPANHDSYRSGFVAVLGRPNVGKSTLVNAVLGTKVTITSPRPNTTRRTMRGVLHRPGAQAVFVDTPGLHKPRSALGRRLDDHIAQALCDVDVVVPMIDATMPVGPGDRLVLERAVASGAALRVALNKIDRASRAQILSQLAAVSAELVTDDWELFPVSAVTGEGLEALVEAVLASLPPGPPYFPPEIVSDAPEAFWVAELVREQLLAKARQELPHSIACRVTEWEDRRVRVEVLVERDSQKGMVIGKGGSVLRSVREAVQPQLPQQLRLELHVTVDKRWQDRPDRIERLGY